MLNELDTKHLDVNALIAHQVPRLRKNEDQRKPDLSQATPDLPVRTLEFFQKRLKRTLQHQGQAVEVDQDQLNPSLPMTLSQFLTGHIDLVEASQSAAMHLLTTQRPSPWEETSLFVACSLDVMGRKGIGLLKLEKEEGVQVRQAIVNDQPTLTIQVLEDLMLTDHTRLFKAGVFWMERNTLYGSVCDTQQGQATDLAAYFLRDFLGCQLQRSPQVVTESFYNSVLDFINKEVQETDKKIAYKEALNAEIGSNKNYVDPIQFIDDYFEKKHQEELRKKLAKSGIRDSRFPKNAERIQRKLKRTRLKTSKGLIISGSSDAVRDNVKSAELEGNQAIIIYDTLTSV